jgi:hypothetical protein
MVLIELTRSATPRQVRQFALGWLPAFCVVLAGLSVYRGYEWPAAAALCALALASLALGIARPAWMRPILLGWMWATFPIGWLASHLLMAVIYFLVMMPIGLALRAAGRDPLERRFDREAETYWLPRTQDRDPVHYFRQF